MEARPSTWARRWRLPAEIKAARRRATPLRVKAACPMFFSCVILDEILPRLTQDAELADFFVGDGDGGKPTELEEARERDGIVSVCLFLGLRDEGKLVGVNEHDPIYAGPDALMKVVDVLSRFDSEVVARAETAAEGSQSTFSEGMSLKLRDVSVVKIASNETGLVKIAPIQRMLTSSSFSGGP